MCLSNHERTRQMYREANNDQEPASDEAYLDWLEASLVLAEPALGARKDEVPEEKREPATLRSCPYCGCNDAMWDISIWRGYRLMCANHICAVATPWCPTEARAMKRWNRRP